MLWITDTISIADWELSESFVRASGPGGQNVNKVSTAVELRFEAERSPNLGPGVKARLKKLAGRRWTLDGAIIIQAEETRSQARNREMARERLAELIRAAPALVRRETLEHLLWGDEAPEGSALRTHIHELRRELDKPFAVPLLQTVPHVGYRLSTEPGDAD